VTRSSIFRPMRCWSRIRSWESRKLFRAVDRWSIGRRWQAGTPAPDAVAMSTPCRRRSRSCTMPRKPRPLHLLLLPLLLTTLAGCRHPRTASSDAPTGPRTLPTPPAELTLPERLTRYDPKPSGQVTSVDKGQLTQLTEAYKQAVAAVAKLNG